MCRRTADVLEGVRLMMLALYFHYTNRGSGYLNDNREGTSSAMKTDRYKALTTVDWDSLQHIDKATRASSPTLCTLA